MRSSSKQMRHPNEKNDYSEISRKNYYPSKNALDTRKRDFSQSNTTSRGNHKILFLPD